MLSRHPVISKSSTGFSRTGLTAELLFFQGNRDESYEVDEGLAEQDATALFEVWFLNPSSW